MSSLSCVQHPGGRRMSVMSSILSRGAVPTSEAGNPHYAITICGFSDTLPPQDEVINLLVTHLLPYHRFCSIPNGNFWVPVDVQIRDHIHHATVSNQQELLTTIESLVNRPLSRDIPLWEIHLLHNTSLSKIAKSEDAAVSGCEGSALYHAVVFRVDHSIGDGVSLVEVLSRMLTTTTGEPLDSSQLIGLRGKIDPIIREEPCSVPCCSLWSPWEALLTTGCKIMRGIGATILTGFGAYDSDTPLNTPLQIRRGKGVTFCENQKVTLGGPWNLEYVKAIKNKLNVPMNDVFVGAFAGAVRRYCEDETSLSPGSDSGTTSSPLVSSSPAESILYRALMAYAFTRDASVYKDSEKALTNQWTLVSVQLPVGEADRIQRINKARSVTDTLKTSLLPVSTMLVNTWLTTCLPHCFMQRATFQAYNRHSCVFSSIPGPQSVVCFGGSQISQLQVLYPNCLPQIEVLTYANRVFFSLVADPEVITRPQKLVNYFFQVLDLRGPLQTLQFQQRFYPQELQDLGNDLGIQQTTLNTVTK